MPKWTMQFIGFKRPSTSNASMIIVSIVPIAHHSNGQDGCTLRSEFRPAASADKKCIENPSIDQPVNLMPPELKLITGSFSTNYYRAGLHYRRMSLSADECVESETTLGGMIERHVDYPFIGGNLKEELKERYGKSRLLYDINHGQRNICSCFDRIELSYRGQYIVGVDKPFVHTFEAQLYFNKRADIGVYVRYYRGRDYYTFSLNNPSDASKRV